MVGLQATFLLSMYTHIYIYIYIEYDFSLYPLIFIISEHLVLSYYS